MRLSIPTAAALLLAACGSNQSANNSAVADAGGPEQVTAVNDTTAIDAATGDAANMAADVNYSFNEDSLNAGGPAGRDNAAASNRSAGKPARPAPDRSTNKAATPAADSPANTTSPTAAGN